MTNLTSTLTVAQALTTLQELDPKRARTFCAADGTVVVRRKTFARRDNGQIIGMDTAKGSWQTTRVDVREAAQYAIAQRDSRAVVIASHVATATEDLARAQAKLAELVAGNDQLVALGHGRLLDESSAAGQVILAEAALVRALAL